MATAPPTTTYRGRVRSGCLTCRSRKIKCDEAKPICKNCARLQRTCTYKPRKSQQVASLPSPCSLDDHSQSPNSLAEPLRADDASARNDAIGIGALSPASLEVHRGNHRSPQSPDSSLADTTSRLKKALQAHGDSALSSGSNQLDDDLPSVLISRDIELTTTMDYLASQNEVPDSWFAYFLETVECPGITPFDTINWSRMKQHVVEMGNSDQVIGLCISAVSALLKAQTYGLSFSGALSLYDSAKLALERVLSDRDQDFSDCLVALFLLCIFELIHSGDLLPFMKGQQESLLLRLEIWAQQRSTHSELSMRIVVWLRIIYGITLRGGGQGLIPGAIHDLLPMYDKPPNLKLPSSQRHDLSTHLLEILVAPLFDFYLRLQTISGKIAHSTHYHRSRRTGSDQQEVVEQLRDIKSQLQVLWNNRCPTHSQNPEDIRSQLAPHLANHIISLIGALDVAYHAEIVELDRVLGDPVTKGSDSRKSMQAIREIVDTHWNSEDTGWMKDMAPAYIRPLFLYAIECMDREENLWAVQMISQMRSSIHRSDFFAAFGKALSDAQLAKDRRVTSKYFCIFNFGVPPPFM